MKHPHPIEFPGDDRDYGHLGITRAAGSIPTLIFECPTGAA